MQPTTSSERHALRDQRTYHVSDERLRAFGELSPLQRLLWVEHCSQFVRMAQAAKRNQEAPQLDISGPTQASPTKSHLRSRDF